MRSFCLNFWISLPWCPFSLRILFPFCSGRHLSTILSLICWISKIHSQSTLPCTIYKQLRLENSSIKPYEWHQKQWKKTGIDWLLARCSRFCRKFQNDKFRLRVVVSVRYSLLKVDHLGCTSVMQKPSSKRSTHTGTTISVMQLQYLTQVSQRYAHEADALSNCYISLMYPYFGMMKSCTKLLAPCCACPIFYWKSWIRCQLLDR